MAIGNPENDALSIKRYILEGSILQLAILLCWSFITFMICMCFPDFDPCTNLELIASIRNPKSISTNWIKVPKIMFFSSSTWDSKKSKNQRPFIFIWEASKKTRPPCPKKKRVTLLLRFLKVIVLDSWGSYTIHSSVHPVHPVHPKITDLDGKWHVIIMAICNVIYRCDQNPMNHEWFETQKQINKTSSENSFGTSGLLTPKKDGINFPSQLIQWFQANPMSPKPPN